MDLTPKVCELARSQGSIPPNAPLWTARTTARCMAQVGPVLQDCDPFQAAVRLVLSRPISRSSISRWRVVGFKSHLASNWVRSKDSVQEPNVLSPRYFTVQMSNHSHLVTGSQQTLQPLHMLFTSANHGVISNEPTNGHNDFGLIKTWDLALWACQRAEASHSSIHAVLSIGQHIPLHARSVLAPLLGAR